MRNLLVLTAAGGGAFYMAQAALGLDTGFVASMGSTVPLGGLFVAPAAIAGALFGAFLAGMVVPR